MSYLTTITHSDIIKKLKFHKLDSSEMQDNLNVIFDIIDATKTIKTGYYICSKGKILDVENLKKVLEYGFYAFFFFWVILQDQDNYVNFRI